MIDNNMEGTLLETFGNLSDLQSIVFTLNKLTGPLPESMKQMTILQAIGLNFNQITKIPESIASCSELAFVHMDFNKI